MSLKIRINMVDVEILEMSSYKVCTIYVHAYVCGIGKQTDLELSWIWPLQTIRKLENLIYLQIIAFHLHSQCPEVINKSNKINLNVFIVFHCKFKTAIEHFHLILETVANCTCIAPLVKVNSLSQIRLFVDVF